MKLLLMALMPVLAFSQTVADAQQQLRQARAAASEELYKRAEATLEALVQRDAGDARALFYRGAVRLELGGVYARQSKFGPAHQLMADACADMDKAVAMRPDDFEIRMGRGGAYAYFPAFLNKAGAAREDLEWVVRQAGFAQLPEARQKGVRAALAALPEPGARPDRFPRVGPEVSPILVAATVTMPPGRSVQWIVDAIKNERGLIATHVLTSIDKPGMIVILTWWKDKQAVNDFFYGGVHKGFIEGAYGGIKPGDPLRKVEITQVGVEVFAPLEGGTVIGGGLTPDTVKRAK